MKSKQELIEEWESAIEAAEFYRKGKEERLISYMKDFVSDLNQLDEPEVLSQEWLDENKSSWTKLKIDGYYIPVEKLQNLLVPEQELVVIPKFVAETIDEDKERGYDVYDSIDLIIETNGGGLPSISDWVATNIEKYARAWLDGYEVEEEQKYFVDDSHRLLLCKWDGDVISVIEAVANDLDFNKLEFVLTEQEIKDYDPRYFAFAKKVEEMEEWTTHGQTDI